MNTPTAGFWWYLGLLAVYALIIIAAVVAEKNGVDDD